MAEPRIAPGGLRQVGPLAWLVSRGAAAVEGTTPPNLFLTLGRRRKLFRGWLHFAARLMPAGGLPRREGEMVILRVAHLRECAYEFQHHTRLARRAGLSSADVERVVAGPVDGWTGRDRAILTAVDSLHHHRDLDDDTWAALRAHLTEPECVELLMLAGHYDMLATVITTLRIQPDDRRPRPPLIRALLQRLPR
ncbi:carboxymuconolactone decarboxylase family protein [Actinomadura sp. WMMB 499]|uniref:carboxymuconolactone decarboxylase family protein n=1 Tax=Actinomadura sp. WMMB 499 TaxID=1219491 RepID=UPI0012490503|nr:carboxymuconolactone decarboxylase family protein [Actinomadura sp. WMMB 499]QFG25224.1 carboxymuconolactone decarboxylase family protein [Actinomadura sp. WMMB 499]